MANLLKSLFIGVYAPYTVAIAVVAAQQIWRAPGIAWLGVLLTHAPMALFFLRVLLRRDLPRSAPLLPLVTIPTLLGAVLAVTALLLQAGWRGGALGLAGALAYAAYLLWYSRFGRTPATALALGSRLPHCSAALLDGSRFDTRELAGRPAVLLFYRGNWCPLCMAQIAEIAAGYRELAARGMRVFLISPQPQHKTARLARRFDAPLHFVVDEGNRIARRLGIAWPHALPAGIQVLGYASESVLPTVVVIDADGRIVLADQTDNYRVRPEPATFIAALESA